MGWDAYQIKQGVVSILSDNKVENERHREGIDNELKDNYEFKELIEYTCEACCRQVNFD